jgi:hypothetical protein
MAQILKTVPVMWGNSTWTFILYNTGRLTCKGPGYGSWGYKEVSVSGNAVNMWAESSSKGPGVLYQTNNYLRAALLFYNTGKKVVSGHVSNKIPFNVRAESHKFGVVFYVTVEDRLLRVSIDGWGHLKIT